jgi:hypothetical protein
MMRARLLIGALFSEGLVMTCQTRQTRDSIKQTAQATRLGSGLKRSRCAPMQISGGTS